MAHSNVDRQTGITIVRDVEYLWRNEIEVDAVSGRCDQYVERLACAIDEAGDLSVDGCDALLDGDTAVGDVGHHRGVRGDRGEFGRRKG